MNFYELTHPSYVSDQESDRENPVRSVLGNSIILPGINCSICGFWASSNRIRVDKEITDKIEEYIFKNNIPDELNYYQWKRVSSELSVIMNIKVDDIFPGAIVGIPVGEYIRVSENDIFHVFPGQLWVNERVVKSVQEAKLSGVEFAKVELIRLRKKNILYDVEFPELWEMVITGKGMRKGSTKESLIVCNECDRKIFSNPDNLKVDESRWDGSDFFHVDYNPNIIIVTKKVLDLFNNLSFSNCRFIPV